MTLTRNPNLDTATLAAAPGPTPARPGDPLVGPRPESWWTGKRPEHGTCPGVEEDGRITSLPLPNLATCTREQVRAYFDNTWALTEVLFSALQGEAAFLTPPWHQLRHPMIFYWGHPPALYMNKLRVAGVLRDPIHPYFEQLFETGVDEMSWDDMSKNEMEWPPLAEVHAYRRRVYETVAELIETHPGLADGHAPVTQDHPLWALFLAFEHERIHIETSSVLIRELPLGLLRTPEHWPAVHASARGTSSPTPAEGRDHPVNPLVPVAAGHVQIGKPRDWPSFGWDNEYGRRSRDVAAFEASRFLVTNGEFHAFVADGGYHDERWWTAEGWQWRRGCNAKWPTWWVADGPQGLHAYRLRTLFVLVDMPWSWPVDVNWYEARAYCAWRTARDGSARPYRLLTESEHHRLRDPAQTGRTGGVERDMVMAACGCEMGGGRGHNLNLAFGSESPVDALPANSRGFHDVFGNVWQWCEDDFNPLAGFEVHPFYDDFSAPCFDGEHRMILGGSFASTGDEASIWSRFHFRPHFFQHAGFRLALSEDADGTCDAVRIDRSGAAGQSYESDEMLGQYLLLHFGEAQDQMPHAAGPVEAASFPRRVARWALAEADRLGVRLDRALDVGCAVGGASFALAGRCREVLGIDLSEAFVRAAKRLAVEGEMPYRIKEEGEIFCDRTARVDPTIDRSRVAFRRGDACALPPELTGYDLVVMANLVCRVPSPRAALGRAGGPRGLVRPGGLLALTCPYTWMEQFTPKGAWLGGRVKDGGEQRSADGLRALLEPDFELVAATDLPMVIREHARKFQYVVPHATLWRRRTG